MKSILLVPYRVFKFNNRQGVEILEKVGEEDFGIENIKLVVFKKEDFVYHFSSKGY